jgi:FkbM family methyltransferase
MKELAYLVQRYLLRRRFLTARSRLFDATFRVVTEDFIGRRLYKHGAYEAGTIEFLQRSLKLQPGDIVLDVGANIGWFAVFFDRIAPEGVEILAFEPDPLNFELLSHNLRVNGCRKVTAVQRAVSDARRTSKLYLYPDKNRGRHTLVPSEGREVLEVETITLDEFLGDRADRVRFMKMDIEGHEYAALAGGRRVLARIPELLMEYSPGLYPPGGGREEILALLYGCGLTPSRVEGGRLVPQDREWLASSSTQMDLLWSRGGREARSAGLGG